MRNRAGFYTKSANARRAEEEGKVIALNVAQSELNAKGVSPYECGVEWHHNGRFIAFYPSNDDEMLKIKAFKERLSKIDITFRSKAQAMRFVEKLPDTSEDNELAIRLKDGKYGCFVCTNSLYFSENDDFKLAPSVEIKREIERLFS